MHQPIEKPNKVKVYVQPTDEKTDKKVIITAIIVLGVIESIALFKGINGTLLRWVTIIIAMLAGLIIPAPKITQKIKEMI